MVTKFGPTPEVEFTVEVFRARDNDGILSVFRRPKNGAGGAGAIQVAYTRLPDSKVFAAELEEDGSKTPIEILAGYCALFLDLKASIEEG